MFFPFNFISRARVYINNVYLCRFFAFLKKKKIFKKKTLKCFAVNFACCNFALAFAQKSESFAP